MHSCRSCLVQVWRFGGWASFMFLCRRLPHAYVWTLATFPPFLALKSGQWLLSQLFLDNSGRVHRCEGRELTILRWWRLSADLQKPLRPPSSRIGVMPNVLAPTLACLVYSAGPWASLDVLRLVCSEESCSMRNDLFGTRALSPVSTASRMHSVALRPLTAASIVCDTPLQTYLHPMFTDFSYNYHISGFVENGHLYFNVADATVLWPLTWLASSLWASFAATLPSAAAEAEARTSVWPTVTYTGLQFWSDKDPPSLDSLWYPHLRDLAERRPTSDYVLDGKM